MGLGTKSLPGCAEIFKLHSNCNGETLEDFEKRSTVIQLLFLKRSFQLVCGERKQKAKTESI